MKLFGWFVVAAALLAAVWYASPMREDSEAVKVVEEAKIEEGTEQASAHRAPMYDPAEEQRKAVWPANTTAEKVTAEQREAVAQQEKEIKSLMREYEESRSDPEKKAQLKAKMREELASYSENAMPVIMEEVQSRN